MSITDSIIEHKADATISDVGRITRTFTEKHLVESTSYMSDFAIGTALGYMLGTPHADDPNAYLQDYGIEAIKSEAPHCKWHVNLKWTTRTTSLEKNSDNPLEQRVKRSWQTTTQQFYAIRDRNDNLIVNAAGQPFEGGVPVSLEMPTLVFERNESDFSGNLATAYANSLNAYYYSGAEPETLRIKITATEEKESIYTFWKVRYEMVYNFLGWQPKPVNAGLYQLVSGSLVRCKDKDRQDVTSPVPLDVSGAQIPVASLPAAANYITVSFFNTVDFSLLGLPEN